MSKRIVPPRQFFFDVLNTVRPEYLEQKLVEYYNQKSMKQSNQPVEIHLNENIFQSLMAKEFQGGKYLCVFLAKIID